MTVVKLVGSSPGVGILRKDHPGVVVCGGEAMLGRRQGSLCGPLRASQDADFPMPPLGPSLAGLVLSLISACAIAAPLPAAQPNIVVIMSDDMGYSDLGCYGGEIPTPNLDALAAGGVRFTQFYNGGRCCPTRASLLTGLYPHQVGVGHMVEDLGTPAYRGNLGRNGITLAEALKPAGYRSYMAGKWHVTPGRPVERMRAHRDNWPRERGFDRFYGTIRGSGSFWDPSGLVREREFISPFADPEYQPEAYYYTDAITDHAVQYVRDHARENRGKPFFLYVAYTAAHWPMHAPESEIAKHRGRYDAGYDAIRRARWEKQKRLGLADESWGWTPTVADFSTVADPAFEARCMEVYAAMVTIMDRGIGQLMEELKATGQYENTLILYLQDNGACAETNGRRGQAVPRAQAPSLAPMPADALQFNNTPPQTRDGWPVRQGIGVMPGAADTYVAYGEAWANVSNTPFREYKHWVHEGGIASPLIAHWPAATRGSAAGALCAEPTHLIDIMATAVDLAGATYPTAFNGQPIQPLEGRSLRPLLSAPAAGLPGDARALFWEHEGNRAAREGRWKLVAKHQGAWELYDLAADRSELHDLARAQPARVAAMAAAWQRWADRVGVEPWTYDIGEGSGASPTTRIKQP